MADLVLSLTKSAVESAVESAIEGTLSTAKSAIEGTLSTAKSAIEEEIKLKKGVQRDLMLISDELEMMQAFINCTKESGADDMTRTLVRQVRNMALDVEDCIEFVVHLDDKSSWWRRLLPACIPAAEPATALDDVVSRIELLKARVEAMFQRNMRYRRIGESSSKLTEQTHQQAVCDTTTFDILTEMKDVVKMQRGPMDLGKLINKKHGVPEHRQVISMWETGGDLRMMSIIRKAYEDTKTCQNFTCRAWLKVPHPFTLHEFLRTLLTQFYTSYCLQQGSNVDVLKKTIEVMSTTEGELIEEFMTKFGSQRYLVVLEDVSSMVEWNTIRAYLPDTESNNGSCIVVHTPQLKIASLCCGLSHRVSQLEQFSDHHSVYVFFKEDGEKGEELVKTKDAQEILEVNQDDHQLVGREIDIRILEGMVSLEVVVPVWGIAGVGKSYLIRHLYCKKVLRGGYEKFGWVNISHPFNLRDLSRSLLLDLQFGSLQHGSLFRIMDPIQECRMLLEEHKCLVVIDGLQSTKEWDSIKSALQFGASGSQLIVITREESVATYCATDKGMVWNVRGLAADHALALFKKKVSEMTGRSSDLSTEVTEQVKLILYKCGGLPKVIVAIADFMAPRIRFPMTWEFMMGHRFMHVLQTDGDLCSLQDLFAWVHSYFRTCSDDLKPCIFYLSIFPMKHIIRRRRLVRRWIAEGYSRDTKESNAEDTAEEFFSKLIKLSVIQLLEGTPDIFVRVLEMRMPFCQVNGFFREYITSRSMEENLVFTLEGRRRMNSQHTGRHLAIESTWDRDRIVFESIDFSRLRSLTVFGEWRSFFISDKMRLLRVLDLEGTLGVQDGDVEEMVKRLPRLKFLSLRHCKNVKRLPDSLGGLRQLETLDVRHTSVVTLPKSIIKLQKLQYIRAGMSVVASHGDGTNESTPPRHRPSTWVSWVPEFCKHRPAGTDHITGAEIPRGTGNLTALHTLGVVDVGVAKGKAILKELRNLTQLHKLGVSGINQNNCREFLDAISDLRNLESLSVQLNKDNQDGGCLDGISSPRENIRSLKLYGLVGKLPVWIKNLPNLTKLNLQMAMLPQEEIDVIGNLESLLILRLCFKEFEDGKLKFREGFFSLLVLEITCNSGLHAVEFEVGVMFQLEVLKVSTSVSSLQFSGLYNLLHLKEVWLSGSYDDALKEYLQSQLAKRRKEIKPVLKEELRSS